MFLMYCTGLRNNWVVQKMGRQILSIKVKIVNIFGFVVHGVCVATTELCPCNTRADVHQRNARAWLHSDKTPVQTAGTLGVPTRESSGWAWLTSASSMQGVGQKQCLEGRRSFLAMQRLSFHWGKAWNRLAMTWCSVGHLWGYDLVQCGASSRWLWLRRAH